MEQVALEVEANAIYYSPKRGFYDERIGAKGDCSAKVTAIFRRAGRYDLTRCRAIDMANGLCGWSGELELFEEAKACSLMFFDTLDKDEVTHVGILTKDTYLEIINALAHASSSKGFIQIMIRKNKRDWFYVRSLGVKRLYGKRIK